MKTFINTLLPGKWTFLILSIALSIITAKAKIHTIGDSTMADYDQSQPDQKGMYGWGQFFGDYLSNGMTTKNWGDRGESARSFYTKNWSKVKTEISKGDYVLIQFGHNDQKSVSTGVYREYLAKFVTESRELGAHPILVTSICRKLFDNDKISRLGRIDNGKANGVSEDDHTYDYPYHMKRVADSLKVQCIDLTSASKAFLEKWGPSGSTQFFPPKGSTHTNESGARVNAQLVAKLLYDSGILKQYIAINKLNIPQNNGKAKVDFDTTTVSDSDTSEDDWNYYMVKTGGDGYATFGNLSGENLRAPNGLTVYVAAKNDATIRLIKIDNIIPANSGVIIHGKPNTEYPLTATTKTSRYDGENYLISNQKTGSLKSTSGANYNYTFQSENGVLSFIKACTKTYLHLKKAYLSIPVEKSIIAVVF